jgi:hypothetical protein
LITDTPSVSEVSRVVARYPLGVHASQNLLHDTPWVCTSTGIHDTLRVCINHKLRGLAVKCTCHTPHSAHTCTGYTCTRVKAELYDSLHRSTVTVTITIKSGSHKGMNQNFMVTVEKVSPVAPRYFLRRNGPSDSEVETVDVTTPLGCHALTRRPGRSVGKTDR